jgi:hypothetical protein
MAGISEPLLHPGSEAQAKGGGKPAADFAQLTAVCRAIPRYLGASANISST